MHKKGEINRGWRRLPFKNFAKFVIEALVSKYSIQAYIAWFISGKVAATMCSWETEFKRATKGRLYDRGMKNAEGSQRSKTESSWGLRDKTPIKIWDRHTINL